MKTKLTAYRRISGLVYLFAVFYFWLLTTVTSYAQEAGLQMPPSPTSSFTSSCACSVLCFIVLGGLLGTAGQIARSAVGLKKEMDAAKQNETTWKNWFNAEELAVSLLLGAAAGGFAAVGMLGDTIDKKFLLACIAAGYAGSDFVQGFITNYLPKMTGGSAGEKNPPGAGNKGGPTAGKTNPPAENGTQEAGNGADKASQVAPIIPPAAPSASSYINQWLPIAATSAQLAAQITSLAASSQKGTDPAETKQKPGEN